MLSFFSLRCLKLFLPLCSEKCWTRAVYNSVTTFMPAEMHCRSLHMKNTASIILMKPKAERFNYCINTGKRWIYSIKMEKGLKVVVNFGYVFRRKEKKDGFTCFSKNNWKFYAQVDLTWKYLGRRDVRILDAQQYHCPRFVAINRQEPTTMPLQIRLRLYSKYPQWQQVSILSGGNNKSCWNWILYSMSWVCYLMVWLVEWFICNIGLFIFEWL